jgi:hypothetical protein
MNENQSENRGRGVTSSYYLQYLASRGINIIIIML